MNPTLKLFLAVFILYFGNLGAAYYFSPLPPAWLVVLFCVQFLLATLSFTPVHDGSHKTAHPNRLVNELIFYGCWPILINNMYIFRKIHNNHHAYTNQGSLDPDHFTAGTNLPIRWAKSFLMIIHYYFYAWKHFKRSWIGQFNFVLSYAGILSVLYLCWKGPHNEVFIFGWFVPAYVAIGLLGFLNTSWPHHPAKDSSRMKNTRNLIVPHWLELLMGYQNYHFVHHYRPSIPWYKYEQFWKENGKELTKQGAVSTSYFGAQGPKFKN